MVLEQWQAEISSSLGHAVATTHTQAIIWRYKHGSQAIDVLNPVAIRLPYPSTKVQGPRDPLPLGILVHDAGAGEVALLVIMPLSGQVSYWESVKQAATIDLVRQKQQGPHGTVSGLLSGESILKITEAEPDGFVLITSNGRIVHLTVKDSQGRPLVSTQFLRSSGASGGSFFGSITNVFSAAAWRRDIAAVQIGPLQGKSHCSCIVVTKQGVFQVWELSRHSTKTLLFETDAKDDIFKATQKSSNRAFTNDAKTDMTIVDFAIFPTTDTKDAAQGSHRLLVLTSIEEGRAGTYNLIDLIIQDGSVEISVIHPISCYSEGQHDAEYWIAIRPRVLLPEPAQTAFLVFDEAIVLVSLAKIEESPSSQLQLEAHTLPDPFQDALHLRQTNPEYHVVGCCSEDFDRDSGKATCVFLIHGFGMARVTTLPIKEGQSALDRSAVTVKSKIEQAVFYGNMPHNLLDFNPGRSEFRIENEELEVATLEINDSIMKSTSNYIPAISPSMEHQLDLRATALAELIGYVSKWPLKASTKWELLWSGEKMAAARAIWHIYNARLAHQSQEKKSSLLPELLDMISEEQKKENQPELGESDIVRHYFIHDVWRIQMVIPWAQQAVEELYGEGVQEIAKQARLIDQADDIQICAMEAAFAFRTANAQKYGLGTDVIVDGIYQGTYDGLPEFWTSIIETVVKVKELTDLSREIAVALNNERTSAEEDGGDDFRLISKLAADNPRLIHICCQVYEERCRWLKSRSDPQSRADGEALSVTYLKIRKALICKTSEIGLVDEGIRLAETYQDMEALVDVLELSTLEALAGLLEPAISENEEIELKDRVDSNRKRLEKYFSTYGDRWANALYSKNITDGAFADLFDDVDRFQDFFTRYLRSKPGLAKLSWINEVLAEHDYAAAAKNLIDAQKAEENAWSKKIELSMAKLALLAAKEKKPSQVKRGDSTKRIRDVNDRVGLLTIQEMLYRYIHPKLVTTLEGSGDEEVMKAFGRKNTEGKPALRLLQEMNLKKLVAHQVLQAEGIIDILTLLTVNATQPHEEYFAHQRFFLALKVLSMTGFDKTDKSRFTLIEKLIWRRCMIQDEWAKLNQTDMKNDAVVKQETSKTALFKTLKAGFEDGV